MDHPGPSGVPDSETSTGFEPQSGPPGQTDSLDDGEFRIDFDVKPAWTIEGEVPPGLATCLLLSVIGPGWVGPVRIDVAADGVVGPGPATLVIDQPTERCPGVTLVGGTGRLTASISAADSADLRPAGSLRPARSWPEDVSPFIGGRPGPAALCEVRPLPGPGGRPLSTDAWVRPTRTGGGARPELLAVDAWLAASQLDFLHENANRRDIDRLPKASWCSASFVVDLRVVLSGDEHWLLRRTATVGGDGSMDEIGAIELADHGHLRPCVSFELRRPRSPAVPSIEG